MNKNEMSRPISTLLWRYKVGAQLVLSMLSVKAYILLTASTTCTVLEDQGVHTVADVTVYLQGT